MIEVFRNRGRLNNLEIPATGEQDSALKFQGHERDSELVQIVDAALAGAVARAQRADGTSWLACHPGCTPCCHGVFRISALDAERLRAGLDALARSAPEAAAAIQERAMRLAEELRPAFPGDARTGMLDAEEAQSQAENGSSWETFAGLPEADAPCPVLDPASGRCELYASRPLTCRIFGPPVEQDGGLAVCELCYRGAEPEDLLHGEMSLQHHELEAEMDQQMGGGETIIAWALLPGARDEA